MAHYAKVLNGEVINTIVAEANFFETFVDDSPGEWIQTSYNMYGGVYFDSNNNPASNQSVINGDPARERKNYATAGYLYDGIGFYSPQPYPSWTLNKSTYLWEPPLTKPNDGKVYSWDESAYQADNSKGWTLLS
tara:strand:+ start:431 stop:832 length:402 start_codon:yes stop_codon:yes gene_type:complete